MRNFQGWSRLDRWLLVAGLLYAVLVVPSGWARGAICHVEYTPACWYADHVTTPLNEAGQGWIVDLLILPPLTISFLTSALTHQAISLVTVPLYTIGFSKVIGHIIAAIWRWVQNLQPSFRRATIGVLTVAIALLARHALPEARMVVPPSVNLKLRTSIVGQERVPVVMFDVRTDEYCDLADPLQVRVTGTPERLRIDISGYRVQGRGGVWCRDSDPERPIAKVPVGLDRQRPEWTGELQVHLHGQMNSFELSLQGYRFALTPRQLSNVVIDDFDRCSRRRVQGEPISVILYPTDVAILLTHVRLLEGAHIDRLLLTRVAGEEGFVPADTVYPGLRNARGCDFPVVVRVHPIPDWQVLRRIPNTVYAPGKITTNEVIIRRPPEDTDLSEPRW